MSSLGTTAGRERSNELRLAKIRFIEEWEAGLRPSVQEYATRFPGVAKEIVDFILTFVATERTMAGSTISQAEEPGELSERAIRRAAERHRNLIASASTVKRSAPAATLLDLAKASGVTMITLVKELNLSNQSVLRILRGQARGVPRLLVGSLAQQLGAIEEEVNQLVSQPLSRQALLAGHHRTAGDGPLEEAQSLESTDFLELLNECADLTEEQRRYWRDVVLAERASSTPAASGEDGR